MAHSYYSFNERQAGSVPLDTIEFVPVLSTDDTEDSAGRADTEDSAGLFVTEQFFDSVEALQRRVAELLGEGA